MVGEVKQPITLDYDSLIGRMVQNAVTKELEKRVAKAGGTIAGQAMKTAGLEDIKTLLATFGITPSIIEQGVKLAFDYFEVQTKMKSGGGFSPGPSPGPSPGGPSHPLPPRSPSPPAPGAVIDPAVMHRNHMALMQSMINAYGDLPLSEAMKRFDAEKEELIKSARQAQGGTAPPAGPVS